MELTVRGPDRRARGHVARLRGGDLAVGPRGEAGQRAELALEVGLVAVARGEGELDPRLGAPAGDAVERTLEALHAAVELRCEAHRTSEERDEAAMAQAALPHDAAHGSAGGEAREGVRHRRMETVHTRKPRGEQRFEELEPELGGADPEQPLARLARGGSPEVFERRVAAGDLVGGHAEERQGGAREELGADRADGPRDVAHVEGRARAADEAVTQRA